MKITASQKKHFRKIGHALKPVVQIGDKGLTANILKEIDRALEDHELIKVKVSGGDREQKEELINTFCKKSNADLAQKIGNTALVYRAAKKPNPKLSNLIKYNEA